MFFGDETKAVASFIIGFVVALIVNIFVRKMLEKDGYDEWDD